MSKAKKIIIWVVVIFVAIVVVVLIIGNRQAQVVNAPTVAMGSYGVTGGISASKGMAVAPAPAPGNLAVDSASVGTAEANIMPVQQNGVAPEAQRMIVKTGQLSIVVKDVKVAVSAVSSYALKNKGFVVSSNISKTDIAPYATVMIRIPVAVFDSGVVEVKALGEVQSESVTGEDVTSQYVDLDARLKNLQATEQQFLAIMKQAVKISDILDVQRELTQVRGEIESLQGQMKYLKESSSYSTLTVNFSTDPSVLPVVDNSVNGWKPWAQIKDAARGLKADLQGVGSFIIWLVVYIPLWIIIFVAVWLVWKIVKFIKRKYRESRENK